MKTNITARISIDRIAWRRVRNQAAREGRSLAEVIGELLETASSEPAPAAPKREAGYEIPALLRLWVRKHPDTVIERD